ncbi:MAG: hypothetical protein KBA18_12090 [Kiritimatiellae bacterium]|jgi:hypothetical protein|nr:hypothetical protein [Kiritimatiellia bacterium]NLG02107.1 hypothetical protein [Lentisphaerota bacterium]
MTKRTLAGVLLAVAVVSGCASFIDNPYFAVKESGLNWVSIRHYNYRVKPIQRVAVRMDGNGIVTVREGSSLLVTNPFASNHNDPNWNDVVESRITLPREEVNRIFQMLVDQGLFEDRRKGDSINTNEAIFVSANIQSKTCGSEDDVFGSDPNLAEHLKNVMLMFYHPQPKRRR